MIKIGNVEIENPVVIAPMAGISNIAFRSRSTRGAVDEGWHYRVK